MKISQEKKDKICEQILSQLFLLSPRLVFTSHLAQELARDEEFMKKLLLDLKRKKLVSEIKKNPQGVPYIRRSRWKLSEKAYKSYKNHQEY